MNEIRAGSRTASVEKFRGDRSKKVLECSALSTAQMKRYFMQVKERAERGEPVIWTGTWEPQEILHAMDLPIVHTIHYSALQSVMQMSEYYLDLINSKGYFRDLCRYCSMPLGYVFDRKSEVAPWGGLPKPAAVIAATMDDPYVKINEKFAREFNVPLYVIDRTILTNSPARWWENPEIEPHRLDQTVREFEGLISFLEVVTGRTYSETKLRETMERSNRTYEIYAQTIDLMKAVPSPISITDRFPNIIATQFFRGTEWGLEHAKRFYQEMKQRVDSGQCVCENEKVRLMWVGLPPWFSPGFFNYFEEKYGAVFVWEGYLAILTSRVRRDLSDPLRALASRYTSYVEFGYLPPFEGQRLLHEAEKFKIDGAIFMLAESCKLFYTGIRFARKALEEAGIPTMELVADMADARDWDDLKMKSHISSFIETFIS